MWVCFGCKTESSGPGFQLYLLQQGSGPKKSSKFDQKSFQQHWRQTITTASQTVWYVSGAKPGHPDPVINLACSGRVLMVPGPRKVVKIGPKHCLVVLMKNDKNCTPRSVGMFRALRRVIWALFSTFPAPVVPGPKKSSKLDQNSSQQHWRQTITTAPQKLWVCFGWNTGSFEPGYQLSCSGPVPVVPGPGKVVKIGPKLCLVVLMENEENCTPKSVGMFRALNRVIWALFLTFPAPVVPEPEKLIKLDQNSSQQHWRQTITTAPQKLWVCFGWNTRSSGIGYQLSLLRACSGGTRSRKSRQNWTEHCLVVLMENDKNCTPESVGMFWALNRVIYALFWTFPAPVVPGTEKS